MNTNIFSTVDEVQSPESLAVNEFMTGHYHFQRPLLIRNTTVHWPALKVWSTEYFSEKVGTKNVTLNLFERFSDKCVRTTLPTLTMSKAIDMMLTNTDPNKRYYILRDSMTNHYPELLADIATPPWVNSNISFSRDLWLGDGGNITPLHFDTADNFFVTIFGSKTFYLYPKHETAFLYPRNILTKGRFNFSEVGSRFKVNESLYPKFLKAECYKVTVEPGDMLYIPPGWWHEVHTNANRTASISYFFNTRGYPCLMWHFLAYQACRLHEIALSKDVQDLLYRANFENAFQIATELLAKQQYWMAVILAGLIVEKHLNTKFNLFNEHVLTILDAYSKHTLCHELRCRSVHQTLWTDIIKMAVKEDNQGLQQENIAAFILETSSYIEKATIG